MNRPHTRNELTRPERQLALFRGFARLAGCGALVYAVAALVFVLVPKPDLKELPAAQAGQPLQEGYTAPKDQVFESNSAETHAGIEAVVQAYFEARAWKELLPLCRDPARVEPLMRKHYESRTLSPMRWKSLLWSKPLRESGHEFYYTRSEFEDHEPIHLMVESNRGEYRVDWESHVRHADMDWRDFVSTRPTEPRLFRVLVTAWLKEEGADTQQIEIRHPDFEQPILQAVIQEKEPWFQKIRSQLEIGAWKNVPLTLRLFYDEKNGSNESNAVRIAGVEGKGWLILTRKQEPST